MYYNSHKIERLTFTNFIFWNAGNDLIDNKDIAAGDPLKLTLSGEHKILNVKLIHEANKVNQFNYSIDSSQSEILFSFDYLGKDDGVILQIIHTGNYSNDLKINGTIKGAGKPDLFYEEKPFWLKKFADVFLSNINWTMLLLLSLILNILLLNSRIPSKFIASLVLTITLIMFGSLIVLFLDTIYRMKYYMVSKPKYFQDFEREYWVN